MNRRLTKSVERSAAALLRTTLGGNSDVPVSLDRFSRRWSLTSGVADKGDRDHCRFGWPETDDSTGGFVPSQGFGAMGRSRHINSPTTFKQNCRPLKS